MNALTQEEATVRINEICYLFRFTKDALGNDVDHLILNFKYVVGIKGGVFYEVKARDYDGIIEEVFNCTKHYLEECAKKATANLRAGYR